MGLFKTELKQPNAWIVWHLGEANVFKDETKAMDFITSARYERPEAVFNGWVESQSGRNFVTVITPYNELAALERAEDFTPRKD